MRLTAPAIFYSQETKLDTAGNETAEWVRNYSDFLGRPWKTVYPYNGEYSTVEAVKYYDSQGRLSRKVDPDGVGTLFLYGEDGSLEYTIADLHGDGQAHFNGTNRITRVASDVITNSALGAVVRRARTYVWATDNSAVSNLLTSSETSVDGLRSWHATYSGGVALTNSTSTRIDAATGYRYATNTAPDGSFTIAASRYGKPLWTLRKDANGNQLSRTDYAYDPHGRQNAVTDAATGTTIYTFNSADQVETVTTPNPGTLGGSPQVTRTYYNKSLQATNIVQPDGTSLTNEYYLTGQLKRTSGSRTYPVEYTYDYAGRMQTMKTWQNYAQGSGDAITTWNYDLYRGWLTNKAYADGLGPKYSYTPAGRLAERTWARNVVTTYDYNDAGDLAEITYSDGTPGVTNSFDRRGRKISVTGPTLTSSLFYDDVGNLLGEAWSAGPLSGLRITNQFDQLLRRTNLLAIGSSTLTSAAYSYDAASRLNTVSALDSGLSTLGTAGYVYLANSPLVSQILFTNSGALRMTTTKQYDKLNRLTSISSAFGSSALSYSYSYNNANQRVRSTLADGSYWIYEYDALGQVKAGRKYWADGTPVPGQQFEYAFDDIGNRTETKTGGDENGWNLRPADYHANDVNQYTNRTVPPYVEVTGLSFATNTVQVNSQTAYRKGEYFWKELPVDNPNSALWTNITVSATGQTAVSGNLFVPKTPEAFSYDPDGNLTNDGRWAYTWDAENRLVHMVVNTNIGPQEQIDFMYDPESRRIQKSVALWTNGNWSIVLSNRYVYDGWNLAAELNATNNAMIRAYTWGLDLSGSLRGAGGVGGLLLVRDASLDSTNFATYDGNGNVMALVNATDSSVTARYEYGPFGEVIRMTGSMAKLNPFRFSTKYQDDETDLLYYAKRFYNASTGRWLGRDPIAELGGLNLYGFVGNAPTIRYDKLGLFVESCPGSLEAITARCACKAAAGAEAGSAGGPLGAITCLLGVVATELVAIDATLAYEVAAIQAENERTAEQIEQKSREYQNYKNRCNESPPPNLANPGNDIKKLCDLWRWQLKRDQDCVALRKAFMDKWYGDNEAGHVKNLGERYKAIEKLKDKIKRLCEPCPEPGKPAPAK